MINKKILYIDMDGVLCDFNKAVESHPLKNKYKNRVDCIPGIYKDLDPIPGAIEAFEYLWDAFDVYILSTPPWRNPDGWIHKKEWIEKHIPKAKRRLILSHHKNLNKGDYLIDDSHYRGQPEFEGEWLHFNTPDFPNWASILLHFSGIMDKEIVAGFKEDGVEQDLERHIQKIENDSSTDQFKIEDGVLKDNIDKIDKEQADMYNAEVEKMNIMMEELGDELKGLKNISKQLNTKK